MNRMKKIIALGLAAFFAFSASAMAAPAYPKRNITNVVVWSAGGGTDDGIGHYAASLLGSMGTGWRSDLGRQGSRPASTPDFWMISATVSSCR